MSNEPTFGDVWTAPPTYWQALVIATYAPIACLFFWTMKRGADKWAMIWLFGGTAVFAVMWLAFGEPFAVLTAKYHLTLIYLCTRFVWLILFLSVLRALCPEKVWSNLRRVWK